MASSGHRRAIPLVRQHAAYDCGPAALLSVLRYWRGNATLRAVRRATDTKPQDDTTLAALAAGARALGFEARGAAGSYDELRRELLPCIAHIITESGDHHFVVVCAADNRRVRVADPARGRYALSPDKFVAQWTGRVLLLNPTSSLAQDVVPNVVTWLRANLRPHAPLLTQVLFLGLVQVALALAGMLVIKTLIDSVIPAANVSKLAVFAGLFGAIQFARLAAATTHASFVVRLNERMSVHLVSDLLPRLVRRKDSARSMESSGDVRALMNDAAAIQSGVLTVCGNALTDLVLVIGGILVIFMLDEALGLMACTGLLGYVMWLGRSTKTVRESQWRAGATNALLEASYLELASALPEIQELQAATFVAGRTSIINRRYQRLLRDLAQHHANAALTSDLSATVIILATLTVGAAEAMAGELALGSLIAAYALVATLIPALSRLSEAHVAVQKVRVSIERIIEADTADTPAAGASQTMISAGPTLEIRGGAYRWDPRTPFLEAVDVRVDPGHVTGIWGPNGTGKTTLLRLLRRDLRLTKGELRSGGIVVADCDDISPGEVVCLRSDTTVFSGTVSDNIALGRPRLIGSPIVDEVAEPCATWLLGRLASGYDTVVAEGHQRLSAGERQVLGLLRALFGKPRILMLDEAANALDAETAELFDEVIERYSRDHAVVIVSHDPARFARAGRLYTIDAGVVRNHDSEPPLDVILSYLERSTPRPSRVRGQEIPLSNAARFVLANSGRI